tara:strand:+ start:60 stop:755 length:696 start_codon:yes stop_codon:yes gene_type:complete
LKNILITGGTSGIGKALVDSLDNVNFDIISSKEHKNEENKFYYKCNLANDSEIDNFIKIIRSKKIIYDGAVFSAGITIPDKDELDFRNWEETLKINFFSVSKILKTLNTNIRKDGSIVLVSSIGGQLGFENNPSYQISKAAVIQYTKSLSVDLAPNVRVNCIVPGYIKTNMTKKSFNEDDKRKDISNRTLLNRWGEQEEVANVIRFLLSNESSYINGQILNVDGGWTSKGI